MLLKILQAGAREPELFEIVARLPLRLRVMLPHQLEASAEMTRKTKTLMKPHGTLTLLDFDRCSMQFMPLYIFS